MAGIDPYIIATGIGALVLTVLSGWSTVQFERDTAMRWRVTKYLTSVLALVLGFGFCQAIVMQFAIQRGVAADSMLPIFVGAVIGSFLVMWGAQFVEYALRRHHGLEALPYRLVRFDLFRW